MSKSSNVLLDMSYCVILSGSLGRLNKETGYISGVNIIHSHAVNLSRMNYASDVLLRTEFSLLECSRELIAKELPAWHNSIEPN